MKTIIVDLDGTLADVRHRIHHVQGVRKKNWKKFFESMHLDPLHTWCRILMIAMQKQGYRISIVSGRPDDYRMVVEEWLKKHDVPYDEMFMRKAGDFRPDTIVKREILEAYFNKEDILFVVDDRPSVVQMWREEGLICLQCDPHEGD